MSILVTYLNYTFNACYKVACYMNRKMVTKNESVVVFCHNDVQEGNLLLTKRSDRNNPVQMIDFEYSAYNYR